MMTFCVSRCSRRLLAEVILANIPKVPRLSHETGPKIGLITYRSNPSCDMPHHVITCPFLSC